MNGIAVCRMFNHAPQSHPFVERVIGTLRREYLDHLFFWTGTDLEKKLLVCLFSVVFIYCCLDVVDR